MLGAPGVSGGRSLSFSDLGSRLLAQREGESSSSSHSSPAPRAWSGSQPWAIAMGTWPSGRPGVTWGEATPHRDSEPVAPKAYPSFIKGPAPQRRYKNTKSPVSIITIKNPKNGKPRGWEEAPGPGARGALLMAPGLAAGSRYCCCYEVGGSDCRGSHRSPGSGSVTSSGVCSASACPGSCPAGQR